MTTMIYTNNFDLLFFYVSNYNDNDIIYTVFITLSIVSIISLPII